MSNNSPNEAQVQSNVAYLQDIRMDGMLDLETMDTKESAVVTAIGFCFFQPQTDELGPTYYKTIDIESASKHGRTISAGTVRWWLQQSKEAQEAMLADTVEHRYAIVDFARWLTNQPFKLGRIWANSPSFDCAIMKSCYDGVGIPWPYPFYMERDVRTAKDMGWPNGPDTVPNFHEGLGVKHDALSDAIAQARLVQRVYSICVPV